MTLSLLFLIAVWVEIGRLRDAPTRAVGHGGLALPGLVTSLRRAGGIVPQPETPPQPPPLGPWGVSGVVVGEMRYLAQHLCS